MAPNGIPLALIVGASVGAGALIALAFLANNFVKYFGADVRAAGYE